MKVVFFEDVEGTAQVGDVKDVKNGFARNFLLPRGIAGPTTPPNLQRANSLAQKEVRRQERLDAEARTVSARLENYTVTVEARTGETGRLFGSVTNRDVAAHIQQSVGVEVEPHTVLLAEPLRELGPHTVTIRFTRNVTVVVTVDVVPDAESRPAVEKWRAEQAARDAEEARRRAEEAYARGQAAAAASTGEDEEDEEDDSE